MKCSDQIKNSMKYFQYLNYLTAAVLLSVGVAGCKFKPKNPTPITAGKAKPTGEDPFGADRGATLPADQQTNVRTDNVIPLPERFSRENTTEDRETLKPHTVYFDYDRSAVRSSERSKVEAVAAFLRDNSGQGVLVEGHCDERGTEQYNLSLGDRRAQAIREYLVNLGIDSQRIHVITYGEAQPAVSGHDESSWSRNRRGEFILLKPK
jgi:peptidoglycan-associated lipoprotein